MAPGTSTTSLDKDMNNLQSYPSFSKADTKESNRSFRGVIRSKIPGASKIDSPRGSNAGLVPDVDKSDAASIMSGKSSRSALYVLSN
jgi:serine/threonine-protein phosphatase PP1 catalytic subunit